MKLEQATEVAQRLSLYFKRKAIIDPSFPVKGQHCAAIITNAPDFEVGYCCHGFSTEDLPRNTRQVATGKAFFQASRRLP